MATNKVEQPFKTLRVVLHPGREAERRCGCRWGRMGTRHSVPPQHFPQGLVAPAGTVVVVPVTHWCVCVLHVSKIRTGCRDAADASPHLFLLPWLHSLSLLALNSFSTPSTKPCPAPMPCGGRSERLGLVRAGGRIWVQSQPSITKGEIRLAQGSRFVGLMSGWSSGGAMGWAVLAPSWPMCCAALSSVLADVCLELVSLAV